MDLLIELYKFLRSNNKLWMLPIIIILVAIGGLLVMAQGSVLAPFIYAIF